MEETSNSAQYCPRYTIKDELEVAAILLELPALIIESDSGFRFPLSWGAKRKRSPDKASFLRRFRLPSPLPSPVSEIVEAEKSAEKVAASSPATPLSFSSSESDDKEMPNNMRSKVKKTKKQWMQIIKQHTESNKMLTREIAQARHSFEELKSINSRLLAKKQEPDTGLKGQRPHVVELQTSNNSSSNLNVEVKLGQMTLKNEYEDHHQDGQWMVDQGLYRKGISESHLNKYKPYGQTLSLFTCGRSGLGMDTMTNEKVGPRGIPDLNVSPGGGGGGGGSESVWMELGINEEKMKNLSRFIAAHARQRRMQICRDKNSALATKLRFSHR